ncbi:hypothetical protein DIPPA_16050 [Diplonema papillatum]|nr:hypothetical protein DIPPA_16050 [Diplonema papillatum]
MPFVLLAACSNCERIFPKVEKAIVSCTRTVRTVAFTVSRTFRCFPPTVKLEKLAVSACK